MWLSFCYFFLFLVPASSISLLLLSLQLPLGALPFADLAVDEAPVLCLTSLAAIHFGQAAATSVHHPMGGELEAGVAEVFQVLPKGHQNHWVPLEVVPAGGVLVLKQIAHGRAASDKSHVEDVQVYDGHQGYTSVPCLILSDGLLLTILFYICSLKF